MQTSGIKIDINSSKRLLYDNSEKIEKVIEFAVKEAVSQKKKLKPKNSKSAIDKKV